MWKALLLQEARSTPAEYGHGSIRPSRWKGGENQLDYPFLGAEHFADWFPDDKPLTCCFGEIVGHWEAEALNLHRCITLVIDGDSIPEHSSDMFNQYIVQFAVQQAALEQSFASGRLTCPKTW